jgi:hypothetical protein
MRAEQIILILLTDAAVTTNATTDGFELVLADRRQLIRTRGRRGRI